MRFQKISSTGEPLSAEATDHAVVLDTITGLMWSANDVGSKELTHKAAEKAVAKLELAGFTDWRLPTVEELFLLADRSRYNPAIDTAAFPSCKSSWYWSSSPGASSPADGAWIVGFSYGHAYSDYRDGTAFVRAVRSVAPASQ